MTASTEKAKQTRNTPQLTKDVRALNVLRNRRAKVEGLDAEIRALETKIAATLGFGDGVDASKVDNDGDDA